MKTPPDLERQEAGTATAMESQPRGNVLHDRSLWLLLASNAVAILLAVTQNWDLVALMWVFWFQSVVIGFFNILRIRQSKTFLTKVSVASGHLIRPTQQAIDRITLVFSLHYGMVHLIYFMFLLSLSMTGMFGIGGKNALTFEDLIYIIPVALLFLGNHLFSYFYNRRRDTGTQSVATLLFYPYARIIPMHLTIILGFFVGSHLLLFLLLKTIADAIMHVAERRVRRMKAQEQV